MDQIPTTPIQPIEQPVSTAPKKNNSGVAIILIALLILLAGLAYIFLMPKSSSLTENSLNSQTPTPQQAEEEKEVDAVDVTDTTESDLMDVEKDINSL